jgi:hypothetical protein
MRDKRYFVFFVAPRLLRWNWSRRKRTAVSGAGTPQGVGWSPGEAALSTRARRGGIWVPGGISAVGHSLFVATGNTFGASSWSDGEAVFRLAPDLHRTSDKRDYFAPPDWRALDQRDLDLGGTAPLPLTIGSQAFILALGKDGRAYLLDQNNLGGIGGSLASQIISRQPLRTAPAAYSIGGSTYVALQGPGVSCPAPASEHQLTVLKIGGRRAADHHAGVVRQGQRSWLSHRDDQ